MGSWISSVTRSWSMPVGRIGDVHVRLHLAFLMLLFYVWITEAEALGPRVFSRGLGFVVVVLGSVIVHEIAHGLMASREKLPQRMLILLPIGGVTLMDDGSGQYRDPASKPVVALAGPAANFLLAGIGVVIARSIAPGMHIVAAPFVGLANLLRSFIWINAFIGTINLLP